MYVRKTQTLVDDIEHKVDIMRNSAVSQLTDEHKVEIGSPLHAEIKTAIESTLWEVAPELKDKMPKEWLAKDEDVRAVFESEEHKAIRYTFESQDGDRIKLPPLHNRWNDYNIDQKYWTPLIQEWITSQHNTDVERDKLRDIYETIRVQLVGFMAKHASLNTALKEMPELELYVPDEYIEKVNKKENRIKATPSAPTTEDYEEVDVDALTRAAVAHRVTTGNK
jgi:hypothetical protein